MFQHDSAPRGTRERFTAAAVLALLCGLATSVRADTFERSFVFDGRDLVVASLVGEVRVEGYGGKEFRVTVQVRGEDAKPDLLKFDERKGEQDQLRIQFPTREHRRYVFPPLGSGSRTSFAFDRDQNRHRDRSHGWLDELLGLASGDRIEVRGRPFGGAIEMWTEISVQVPQDRAITIQLGAGSIDAKDVRGDVDLVTRSGPVSATGIQGQLLVDTGSGSVDVSGVRGSAEIDTGSGGVDLMDVSGADGVKVDTGSGSVRVEKIEAQTLNVDTGSGGVTLEGITVRDLSVDTGSGRVNAQGVSADDVLIDTGSGSVDLSLTRMGKGRFGIETGSGSITVTMPREISAEFDVQTGSGRIVADLEGVSLGKRSRREASFTVGDGASRVTLSTGSGSIRMSQR